MFFVFVTTYPWNEPVINNRLKPLIDAALDRGFHVKLISPGGCNYEHEECSRFSHESVGVVKANTSSFFVRAFREAFLALKTLSKIPKKDDQYVFVTIPSMFLMFLMPGNISGRALLDIRDLSWEYLSEKKVLVRWARKVFRWISIVSVKRFEFVTVTNSAQFGYVNKSLGVSSFKIATMSNGISKSQYERLSQTCVNRVPRERFRVTYIGNVGLAQNLMTMVQAAELLTEVDFFVVGSGTDIDRIRGEVVTRNLSNMKLVGRVEWGDIPKYYSDTDVLYAQLNDNFSDAVPSKLYEYLSTGKPVIYGGEGQALEVLNSFENVHVIPSESYSELVSTISEIREGHAGMGISDVNKKIILESFIRETIVESFYNRVLKHEW